MTYCVGMVLDQGLVFMSDTRTNAGLDNISTYRKLYTWEAPGERVITLMTAGNLATTQSVISLLEERNKKPDDRVKSLLAVPSMFQAARLVADTLREVISRQEDSGQAAESFNATIILGGQISGGPPRLFLIYPEGNFIEAGEDTPFFQSGESKYGRPILVRADDRTAGALFNRRGGAGMVEMAMREPDANNLDAKLLGRAHEAVNLAAGINEGAFHGLAVPDQRGVLLQRRHRDDANVELGLLSLFGHERSDKR